MNTTITLPESSGLYSISSPNPYVVTALLSASMEASGFAWRKSIASEFSTMARK
jgi:hypothetical protein